MALLQRIMIVPLTHDIVVAAATVGDPRVRTIDALYLATAVAIAPQVEVLVSYDKRLADSATALGLAVAAPA